MERALAQILSGQNTDSNDMDTDEGPDEIGHGRGDIDDMLVTQEGYWIEGNRMKLMRIWKGLKGICHRIMPEQPELLAQASFALFASFAYRWTAAEDSSSSSGSEDDDGVSTAETELTGTGSPSGDLERPPERVGGS